MKMIIVKKVFRFDKGTFAKDKVVCELSYKCIDDDEIRQEAQDIKQECDYEN